ncbi:MAG: hydroxyacylglutathione hydrolase, partial [Deltaproteobacteria bacterium]|nr:hydroxyacylglutathione hydrolase [Deltaproteobacteria bacterium]
MFLQQIEAGNFAVFAYLLSGDSGGEGLVIDPADEIDTILGIAARHRIDIKYIVNTHAHVDHIMGNAEMKQKTGAKIIIHENDGPLLTQIPRSMLAM